MKRINDAINESFGDFTKNQKVLSQFILSYCDKAAFMTAAEIAAASGVSQSTVVRFAWALGYESFTAFHDALQNELKYRITALEKFELLNSEELSDSSVFESLAQADSLAYPAGTGVNISFTDSLPWVSVLFKLLAPVLPAQFQWFGLYELAAFILQGMAAALVLGLFLYDLLPLAAGTALFAFSPIMIERAFRHVALSSHYIVLFALYAYLRGRREQRCFMPVFWLLAALGVGITPYFLPMAAIFALLLAVENAAAILAGEREPPANCWPPAGCFWAPARPGMRRAWCWVR